MTRGEVYSVNLDITMGGEIRKTRPAVIISSNLLIDQMSTVVVCPITDATGKKSRIHVLINRGEAGLSKDSVAHCAQIRSVDKGRLNAKIGNLSPAKMKEIDMGLREALGL